MLALSPLAPPRRNYKGADLTATRSDSLARNLAFRHR